MMNFHILTLFPEIITAATGYSILQRAQKKGLIKIKAYNLRDYGLGRRQQVDDKPYGGGAGMVIRVDVVDRALRDLKLKIQNAKVKTTTQNLKTILLTPQGQVFNQQKAAELVKKYTDIILICGHYEGFDDRICELADEEISLGDFVMSGGEPAAVAIVDAVGRLVPNVLSKKESTQEESFSQTTGSLLEYPHYTQPAVYQNKAVPLVLLSGHHQEITKWRRQQSLTRTQQRRPDLLNP